MCVGHEDLSPKLTFAPVSNVNKILPLDPKQPKYIRIVFEKQEQDKKEGLSGIAEFDTEEAAIDWRKELKGPDIFFLVLVWR